MALTTLGVAAISITSLYETAFAQQRLRLIESVNIQARLIQLISQTEPSINGVAPIAQRESMLNQIVEAQRHFGSFGKSGIFTLAHKVDQQIEYIASSSEIDLDAPSRIPFAGEWAEPMRRALSGETGTLIGLDFHGKPVLAAFQPVGIFDLGLVAKIDLAEIRLPFYRAGLITLAVAIIAILISSSIFLRITQPISRRIEQQAETFKTLVETVTEGIILIDSLGIIQFVNPAAEALFGYAYGELHGRNVKQLMPSPHREAHDQYIANYLETGVPKIIGTGRQLAALRKDGSHFPMYLSVGDIDLGHTRLFTGVILDLSEQQQLQREIMDIPVREQRRIGQELHDGVGQQLTGLGMLATSLLNKATKTEHALASQLVSGLKEALGEVRALSRGLMPTEITVQNFAASVANLAFDIEQQSGIPISLKVAEPTPLADEQTAMNLYRIVQEALNNAVKHANASTISVNFEVAEGFGLIEVTDNGVGLTSNQAKTKGLGLRIMKHRCGLFNGEFSATNTAQGGARIACRFPIHQLAVS